MHACVKLLGLSCASLVVACGRTEPGSLSHDLLNGTTLSADSDVAEATGTTPGGITPQPSPGSPTTPVVGSTAPGPTFGTTTIWDPTNEPTAVPTSSGPSTCWTGVQRAVAVPALTFNDGYTTIELSAVPGTSSWCVKGQAENAGPDFSRWGAGFILQVASADAAGNKIPVDLTQYEASAVRFGVEAYGRPVRVLLTQVNNPNIPNDFENFETNGFELYGATPFEFTSGVYDPSLTGFGLPDWTLVPYEFRGSFDPTQFNAIQFIIPNPSEGPFTDYAVCIHDLAFVNNCDQPVLSLLPADDSILPSPTTTPSSEPPQTTDPAIPTDTPTSDEPAVTSTAESTSEPETSEPETDEAGWFSGAPTTSQTAETSASAEETTIPAPAVDAGSADNPSL